MSRSFRPHDDLFPRLGDEALASLATANSDIAIILSADGRVLDVAYEDGDIRVLGADAWIGQLWRETVTVESREKIDELLDEATRRSPTRSRQVNHPATPAYDLPVRYRVASFAGAPYRIAFGTDLRAMAEMQQRLVDAQVEMEKDYRKRRDIESRYRMLFQLSTEPMLVVEGQTLKVLEVNDGAAKLLGKPSGKLVDMLVAALFAKPDQMPAVEALKAIAARARPEVFRARQASSERPLAVSVVPFREFGKTNLLVRLANEDSSPAGRPFADGYRGALVESLPDGLIVVNGEANIVDANPAFLDLIRVMTFDLVEEKGLDNWLGGSGVDVQVLMANLREHGTMRRFSSVIRDSLGGIETVEVSAAKFSGGEGPLFGMAFREAPPVEAVAGLGGARTGSTSQLVDLVGRVPLKEVVRDTADIIERLCIEAALRLTDNNRASAADMLGLSRQSLYLKLKRYGISDGEEVER